MFKNLPNVCKYRFNQNRYYKTTMTCFQNIKENQLESDQVKNTVTDVDMSTSCNQAVPQVYPKLRVVPMVLNNKDCAVVLPFDEVPGPKTLKYLSSIRHYLSEVGTQLTAGTLTFALNMGNKLKYLYILYNTTKNIGICITRFKRIRFLQIIILNIIIVCKYIHR